MEVGTAGGHKGAAVIYGQLKVYNIDMKTTIMKIMTAAVCLAGMTSCHDHEPLREYVDISTAVGSILCADGSTVPYSSYNSDMNGMGVIVKAGGPDDDFRFIAIGKEDIGWFPYVSGENTDLYVDSGASVSRTAYDGKENTAAMMENEYYKSETKTVDGVTATVIQVRTYPAAAAAVAYKPMGVQGWHLPSSGEWLAVFTHLETVRRSLVLIEGQWIDPDLWYQSSTQDGASGETSRLYNLAVSASGTSKGTLKTDSAPVRPFITIK